MKRLFLFFIPVFILMSVFGVFAVALASGHMENGQCTASFLNDIFCPHDALALISHHFSFFQTFYNALVFQEMNLSLFLAGLFLLALVWFSSFFSFALIDFLPGKKADNLDFFRPVSHWFRHWLSLLENSPSF